MCRGEPMLLLGLLGLALSVLTSVHGFNSFTCFRCSMGKNDLECTSNTMLCHSPHAKMMCITQVQYDDKGIVSIERGCVDGTNRKHSMVDVHDCKSQYTCEHVCASDFCNNVVPPKPAELGAVCFYCNGENTNMACNSLDEAGLPSMEHARYCPSTKDTMACFTSVTFSEDDTLLSVNKGCFDGDKCEFGLTTCDATSCSQCCDGENSRLCNLEAVVSMRKEYNGMAKRCYFCKNADEADECGMWIGCKNNEICYTREIATSFSKKKITKGCVPKSSFTDTNKYDEPICSDNQNDCSAYCDGDLCNTHTFKVRYMKEARKFKTPENKLHARGAGEWGSCRVFGAMHLRSFDGRWLHFQGACLYLLLQDNSREGMAWTVPSYTIFVDLYRGQYEDLEVGFIKRIIVRDGNNTFILGQDMKISINGVEHYGTPIVRGNIVITRYGEVYYMSSKHRYQIKWDGKSKVEVSIPYSYMDKLSGLCGNFNDDPADDWVIGLGCPMSSDIHPGHQTGMSNLFGPSWWVADDDDQGCANTCDHFEPDDLLEECMNSEATMAICNLWFLEPDLQGPFREILECMSNTDKAHLGYSCRYDVCQTDMGVRTECELLRFTCLFGLSVFGIKAVGWRDEYSAKCDSIYPENGCEDSEQEFKSCAPQSVHHYCRSFEYLIVDGCDEGCFCHNHTYWNGRHCVSQVNCGCSYETYTVPVDTKIMLPGCKQMCHCKPGATELDCHSVNCAAGAECVVQDGKHCCRCPKGKWSADPYRDSCGDRPEPPTAGDACTCDLQGHPNFQTFDAAFVHIPVIGQFLLTAHPADDSHNCEFYITVEVVPQSKHSADGETYIKSVTYEFLENTIVLAQNTAGVTINGKFTPFIANLPITTAAEGRTIIISQLAMGDGIAPGVELRSEKCRNQVIQWRPDDADSDLIVRVSHEEYAPRLRGYCGNCDGDKENDYTAGGVDVRDKPDRNQLMAKDFEWNYFKATYLTK